MCKPAAIISEMALVIASLLALFALVAAEPDAPFRIVRLLYSDSFAGGMNQWAAELEKPGVVEVKNGILHLDVPAGATVWFRPELRGPVMIQYELSLIHISEPTRLGMISYAVFCL